METKGNGLRVFGIDPNGTFGEYTRLPFEANHTEAALEQWLESNPDGIAEEGRVMIVGRQVETDLGGYIDLLGLDRDGNVLVVELKRDRTPRDTIAQALEYGAFAEKLDATALEELFRICTDYEEGPDSVSLADQHRRYFGLGAEEGVAFNKTQRLVIVGQRITAPIRQTAAFLTSRGIHTTCIEFSFFEAEDGKRLFAREVVIGSKQGRPRHVVSASQPKTNEQDFLGFCDEIGRPVFERILDWARANAHSVNWGTKGFSVGVDSNGERVVVCYGYPPGSVYRQSIYTALEDRSGLGKTSVPEQVIQELRRGIERIGLFVVAGREVKWVIENDPGDEPVSSLLSWLDAVGAAVHEHGMA